MKNRARGAARLPGFVYLIAACLLAGEAMACKSLVEFDAHLGDGSPGWFKDYLLADIVEVHRDRLVVTIKRRFDGGKISPMATALPFIPGEEAHAVCETRFEPGQTFLLRISTAGGQEQISRFNGYDVPASDAKFRGYVSDLERAGALAASPANR